MIELEEPAPAFDNEPEPHFDVDPEWLEEPDEGEYEESEDSSEDYNNNRYFSNTNVTYPYNILPLTVWRAVRREAVTVPERKMVIADGIRKGEMCRP